MPGILNCHSTEWGYNNTNDDGKEMKNWVFSAGVTILFDVKHPDIFQSIRWGRTSNHDLAFASMDTVMIHR